MGHYIDFDGNEHYYTMTEYPPEIEKKVKLLNYFMNYMKEHLLKAGANMQTRDGDELSRIPFLRTWFRTSRAVVMFLTNGTVQINFFKELTPPSLRLTKKPLRTMVATQKRCVLRWA